MSDEPLALSTVAPALPAQGDYDAICAALMRTERGRWFLQEYAKRNRNADTEVLLIAIQRLETVVQADKNEQAQQSFRSDLLEMAEAITRTRAEVAEIRTDAPTRDRPSELAGRPLAKDAKADVFAAAERIRDVTWAIRGHGFDPSVCNQLEELAASILSASSLRDPADHRTHKLSEVLQYLEQRIDTLLDGLKGTEAGPSPDTDEQAAAPGNEHLTEPSVVAEPEAPSAAGSQSLDPECHEPQELAQQAEPPPADDIEAPPVPTSEDTAGAAGLAGGPVDIADDAGEAVLLSVPAETAVEPEPEELLISDAPVSIAKEAAAAAIDSDLEAQAVHAFAVATLLPPVDLPRSSRILLRPIAAQPSTLMSRGPTDFSYLNGISSGAALWDFDIPESTAAEPARHEQSEATERLQAAGPVEPAAAATDKPNGTDWTADTAAREPARSASPAMDASSDLACGTDALPSDAALPPFAGAGAAASPEDVPDVPAATEVAMAHMDSGRTADVPAKPSARPSPAADDPLAPINALSAEERIALFT